MCGCVVGMMAETYDCRGTRMRLDVPYVIPPGSRRFLQIFFNICLHTARAI